jgi:hypothetical protein
MKNGDLGALEAELEALQKALGATESIVSTWGSILPLLTPEQRLSAALGVYLALEIVRERRRDQGSVQGGGSQGR